MSTKVFKQIPGMFLGLRIGPDFMETFRQRTEAFLSMFDSSNTFFGDSLFTCSKSLGFLTDEKFRRIVDKNAVNDIEETTIWRTHVLCWAAESALALDGDFVECGCYLGYSVACIAEFVNFAASDRHYYLYDVFENPPEAHDLDDHGSDLHEQVKARFADFPNITVTKGVVPAILDHVAPEKIAFMHIDMNSITAEIGALERLFDRVTAGGMIVLDDYGWSNYRPQKEAHDRFFAERGLGVLDMPTGQGLVIKR